MISKIGILSKGIIQIPSLRTLLNVEVIPFGIDEIKKCNVDAIAGWGLKKSTSKSRSFAFRENLPFLHLEDGFCRSVGLGSQDPPLSIVVDDIGIYYHAGQASKLEELIAQPLTPQQHVRARNLQALWQQQRVSKYNHLREYAGALPDAYVLVVDQTLGDASITYGQANAASFTHMLDCALQENPDSTVLVKIHPDVFAGKKKGHFNIAALQKMPRVQVLAEDVHPTRLLEHAQAVYVVTSQMGFEALLWNKKVRTFGMPFYAGWGLTIDELAAPERRTQTSNTTLEQLIHAALIDYPRYLNPETLERCEAETLIKWLGLQRKMQTRFNSNAYALYFSRRKRPILAKFIEGCHIQFVRNFKKVPSNATVVTWGRKLPRAQKNKAAHKALQFLQVEDGFIRSVGLGADLVQPLSWVIDSQGMYYDATQPSDLEVLLQNYVFDEKLLSRAKALRAQLLSAGITKYNVGAEKWLRPAEANGKKVILVPGQVESDESLQWGAPTIRTNFELLQAVRLANPNAYIVYKPHPDVVAQLRAQGTNEAKASMYCNAIVTNAAMHQLLTQVDEVHVLTSLTGFEALLRNIPVTTYGCPFYAGWGLTQDMQRVVQKEDTTGASTTDAVDLLNAPLPAKPSLIRRTRQLQLDELVAAALILYPTYISRTTNRYTTPEQVIRELITWRDNINSTSKNEALPKSMLRKLYVSAPYLRTKRWILNQFTKK